jgi:outer membrane receptor protein involved in Fe transport
MPGVPSATDSGQPDINGIPISAVERIEILPSTAGGLYGGGATGGVVNIILKRNYNDLELTARYDGTFAGGGAQRRLDATAGFTVEGGRTNVMITGSHRNSNPLYIGHRHFSARAWALADQNNHATFLAQSNPVHGYTTNVRSVNGSDLVLKDGMVSLDSPIAHVPVGYAGPASDNGAAFLGTADEYNLMPANDVLGNLFSLLPTPRVRSLQLSVRREFTDRIEAFVDAARYDNYSVRMGSTAVDNLVNITLAEGPNNPFDQAVRLSVPLVGYDTGRLRVPSMSISDQLAGGVIVRLPREWTVQGEYALGRSEWVYQFPRDLLSPEGTAALLDGRLDPLSDVNAYPLDFSSFYSETDARISGAFRAERESAVLRVSGPLFQLPGGPLRVAGLLERREQFNGDAIQATYPLGGGAPVFTYYGKAGSMTESGYAELNAPLVSSANARPGLLALDLRASYRYDTTDTRAINNDNFVPVPSPDGPFPDLPYQTNSVTGNQYTLGFRYTPVQNVTLRLSYGEGILPPAFGQLGEFEFPPAFLSFNRDPKRGGLPVNITTIERFTVLGSLQLRPERSASWSGGMIFTPAHLPGFRVSVDYTRIEKTDEIGSLGTQTLLDLEDDFLGVIVRNELTAADAALGYTGGTIRVFNAGPVNVARTLMEAFDIQADYRWETRFGSFAANVLAAVQPRLSLKATPGGDEVNRVGYSNGPLKWRGSAGVNWSRGPLDLGWNLQYYDASRVYTSTNSTTVRNNAVLTQGSEWIPTQTYNDVYGRYRFENASDFVGGLLENTELQVSVQNLFNTSPPILASSSSFTVAGYATEGDPRLRRYSIAFTKRFGR